MGTNYYTKFGECKKCKRYEQIHLGKCSAGWQFSFQYNGGLFYKNIPEMRVWLKGKKIKDEYGKTISYKQFWKMIDERQADKKMLNHTKEIGYGINVDGYSFSDGEFS